MLLTSFIFEPDARIRVNEHRDGSVVVLGNEELRLNLPPGTGKLVACAICEATGLSYEYEDYRYANPSSSES